MSKKAKVTVFFRPTVLHDHAASRLVKIPFTTNSSHDFDSLTDLISEMSVSVWSQQALMYLTTGMT